MTPIKRLLLFADRRKYCTAFARESEGTPYEQIALGGELYFRWQVVTLDAILDGLQWPRNSVQILIRSARPLDFPDGFTLPETNAWEAKEVSEISQSSEFQAFQGAKEWVVNGDPLDGPRKKFPTSQACSETIYLYTFPRWIPPASADGKQISLWDFMQKIAQAEQHPDIARPASQAAAQLDPHIIRQIALEPKEPQEDKPEQAPSHSLDPQILQQMKSDWNGGIGKS